MKAITFWRGVLLGLACFALLEGQSGVRGETSNATVLTAGSEWVTLAPELDIVPGSALDFSKLGFQKGPAGSHGRVIANANGQFAFAESSKSPQRFYGVNLCFGAQYLSHAEADQLADRLARIGYNAVRIHHYERDLVEQHPSRERRGVQLRPDRLEQLDYLLAAFAKRGLYITTDLFVSRPIRYADLGIDQPGQVPMNHFKVLVPVQAGAWENWKEFARQFLTHTNAYTGLTYGADPALAWLSMINEGNFGNYLKEMREIPEWKTTWNAWLASQYASRATLAATWKEALKPAEDAAQGTVELPDSIYKSGPRERDFLRFIALKEQEMMGRMRAFIRDELGCDALLTNDNAWTNQPLSQGARTGFDYVDDHFYVDHPEFIEHPWQLPSRCANASPLHNGVAALRNRGFTRLYNKPYTITEYNFSGPGQFRGVGGILTGAFGALQGWSGIWRFAYSHSRAAMFEPAPMNYFDLAADPLSLAAERASLCLFLRGDLQSAPRSIAIVMTTNDFSNPPAKVPSLNPSWDWAGWLTRVGTQVHDKPQAKPRGILSFPLGWKNPAADYPTKGVMDLNPYNLKDTNVMACLRSTGVVRPPNPTDPAAHVFRSETGEITLDGTNDSLILDTPRTAGGYSRVNGTIDAPKGGVQVEISGADATVWVSSLDENPIGASRHLLVTHLTDLQNTGIAYREEGRKTLLQWGHLPYLVRNGEAKVRIRLQNAGRYKVWSLSPGGRRLGLVPMTGRSDQLSFTAQVAGTRETGAVMLYEIARQ
jgi:hypothetical protein